MTMSVLAAEEELAFRLEDLDRARRRLEWAATDYGKAVSAHADAVYEYLKACEESEES